MTTKHEHVRTNLSRRSFLVGTGIVALGSFMAAALFQLAASAILKTYWSRKI